MNSLTNTYMKDVFYKECSFITDYYHIIIKGMMLERVMIDELAQTYIE